MECKINPTTITSICTLSSEIDYYKILEFLDLDPETDNEIYPYLFSIRDPLNVRGINRTAKKPFKNAITVDIKLDSERIICVKLTKKKIHICGVKSMNEINDISRIICDRINKSQNLLKIFREKKQEFYTTLKNIALQIRGKKIKDFKEKNWLINNNNNIKFNGNINKQMFDYITKFVSEFTDIYSFTNSMQNFLSDINFCTDYPISVVNIKCVMINFNYERHFNINKSALAHLLREHGFYVTYNNTCDSQIIVHIKSENNNDNKKISKTTFRTRSNGMDAQTSPNFYEAERSYKIYNDFINQHYKDIVSNEIRFYSILAFQ